MTRKSALLVGAAVLVLVTVFVTLGLSKRSTSLSADKSATAGRPEEPAAVTNPLKAPAQGSIRWPSFFLMAP